MRVAFAFPHPAAVIRIDRAAMPDRLQRVDARLHDLARGLAVDIDHQTHAAGRMLVLLAVQAVAGHPIAAGLFLFLPILAHR